MTLVSKFLLHQPLNRQRAKLTKAPIACEAVRRIDELFEIERSINGCTPGQRLAVRQRQPKPLVDALVAWLRERRDRVSSKTETAIRGL
jgi:transposase